ncbi:MAG: AAA family ATPase, partial [Candidatus Tectomicrobia bacterium]|nr:AAA family ATPase [Candidatus Tectomicrobia bacterium]
MKINRLQVIGLFDRFNHDLKFKPDERIMIMIGANGFGKTMILRLIDTLFNKSLRGLAQIPFRQVVVSFDDGSRLKVSRELHPKKKSKEGTRYDPKLTFQNSADQEKHFIPQLQISPKELGFPVGIIEDVIPLLDQVTSAEWRHRQTGEILELEDVLDRYGDELPGTEAELEPRSPKWLQELRTSIPVRFIDTERLTHPLPQRNRSARFSVPLHGYGASVLNERTVRRYSEELGKLVQQTLTDYGALSQSLDRTFPVRLVEEPARPELTMEALREELAQVEEQRSRLVEAGLLAPEPEGLEIPALDKVDESRRGVLAVYARDAKKKLGVFDELYAKVDALMHIANARFLHKRVTVGPDGLGVATSDGSPLALEVLSSGEQHELVMIYDLLFRVPDNSLILIDEPELTL